MEITPKIYSLSESQTDLPDISSDNSFRKLSTQVINDSEHEKLNDFISTHSKNENASIIWLKINNKILLQNKIGFSGFKNLSKELFKELPLPNDKPSICLTISDGIYVIASDKLSREKAKNWIVQIQKWINNYRFSLRKKHFEVIIKPLILTNLQNKSNIELLIHDAEKLLFNSETGKEAVFVSEGEDQRQFYAIKNKLKNALHNRSFNWLYQIIISTKNEDDEIFQLLQRIIGDDGKPLNTTDYLDIANRTGLLKKLDRFTLEQAISTIQAGENKRVKRHVLINQLISDYESKEYRNKNLDYIKEQQIPKDRLVFQFRQDMVEEHTSLLIELGKELRKANITICLSEFDGSVTGWNIAKALDIHWMRLKPIKNEPSGITKTYNNQTIGNLINKGHSLGYKIMVPNIDSASLTANIWTLNADFIQGNFIHAPEDDLKYIKG